MSRFLTLDIGASKATLAEYALKGKRDLTLVAYGTAELAVPDMEAEGALSMALTPVLHGIMREKGIKAGPVIVSISGQSVFPRFAKFPAMGAEKLEQMVRYEVEQNVPFPIDEIVESHQFLGKTPEGEESAMIVAAKLATVRMITDAVRTAGLTPIAVDVAPMAVYNTLRFAVPNPQGCVVVLDIGAKTTSLIIVEEGRIYNRTIPVAGNTITKEISQALVCSLPEADQLKCERGYVSQGGVTEDADETADRISKVIRTVLTRLHAEISRSINFYRSQQGGTAPTRLYLTGGSVALPELDRFFSDSLQVDVEYLNPFGAIKLGPKVNKQALSTDAFRLALTVGLALRQTDIPAVRIDLMPPELIELARTIKRIPFLVAGAAAVLLALGVSIVAENRRTEVVKAEAEQIENRNSALKGLETKLKAAQDASRTELETCDEFQKLLSSRSLTLMRLDAVRKALVPGSWITAWEPDKGGAVRVTVRGWTDELSKQEAEYAKGQGGKRSTAAEIVQASLKGRAQVVADSIKVVAQKDVKGCLTEFTIQLTFADAPTALADGVSKAKGKKAKGGR